ncbi:potassium-transporting ATPase subunit KdpC [Paenibacillus sp. F411]|uniref:Potassium-transporting ATPase KdpC subunit n=1 Tax=Paenibacillus algicola TaxID=2565926 RepID=A0A4P8XPC8_9BACL|nr:MULTISPECIES: potassium-transporting ATPase subunit KdpC [Paenibacillus]MBO2944584.1 potassium-transporting ATPase subunit KdpC [Paenibacillus sp. F411]QCT04787.1 Potassium-transporting ATPase C chain [Paenibacillus algicola]
MKMVLSSIRLSLSLMLLCGLVYNVAVTVIAQTMMAKQADGSLIYNPQGTAIGSELIGQSFTDPSWFQGRLSSIEYAAEGSGSPNYAPSHPELHRRMQELSLEWRKSNPDAGESGLPQELMTNSASGLDPHIHPEAARAQVPRISELRGLSDSVLYQLIREHTSGRQLGFLGEPVVNVTLLNLAMQELN